MKRLLLSIVAATALLAPHAARAADPIYGVWVREGHPTDKLEFYDCAGKLCAKGIKPMPDGRPAPQILRSAAKTGANSWKGDLFNPEDGKTYSGKITYDSQNQLTLTGCLVAFLCQSETWTRVSGPTKATAPEGAKGEPKGPDHDAKATDKPHDAKATEKPHDAKAADKPHDAKGGAGAAKSGNAKPAAKPASQAETPAAAE